MGRRSPQIALLAHRETATTSGLARACRMHGLDARVLTPRDALLELERGDVALARLDVRDDLAGIEPGIWELRMLERRGVRVLNPAFALVATHDKLLTARRLVEAGIAHPETVPVDAAVVPPPFPLVVKPRFGSWGLDVVRCDDADELDRALEDMRTKPWFRAGGAVVQELVPPLGRDLRVVVAAGHALGAIERVAAPGEWRTNISLGGARRPIEPPAGACELAVAAAAAAGADLAGVDLLPLPGGGHVVLEVNGTPDFTRQYRRQGDVYAAVMRALVDGLGATGDTEVEAPASPSA